MNNKLKGLLIISLILNLLLSGILIGKDFFHFHHNGEGKDEALDTRMQAFRMNHKDIFDEIQQERQKAIEMLNDKAIDRAIYLEQIDKINNLQGKMFKDMSLYMLDIVESSPHHEREKVLDHFKHKRHLKR